LWHKPKNSEYVVFNKSAKTMEEESFEIPFSPDIRPNGTNCPWEKKGL
jgi:hypothetical protein